MSRTVCGICWALYDAEGNCECEVKTPEPVAWMYEGIKHDGTKHGPHLVWKPTHMDAMSAEKGAKATPLYAAPPRCPNCASLEAQNTELDRKLAELEKFCDGNCVWTDHHPDCPLAQASNKDDWK